MPDESKRRITRRPSPQGTSRVTRRNATRGLSLPVALGFFFVVMLIATLWSASALTLSWPFLILFTCASLAVITFTRFEGLFLATCSVPLFYGIFSVVTGWLISELQTTSDTRGTTNLVASFYPFVQHFPVLLITALGGVIIAVFRWTAMAHKVTDAAERGVRERKKSHISNARLSHQSSSARRLNTDSLQSQASRRHPQRVQNRGLDTSPSSEHRAGDNLYRPPTSSRGVVKPATPSNSDPTGRNALGTGNQRSLQGSTQVPLLITDPQPRQDYAGGIVSGIPNLQKGDSFSELSHSSELRNSRSPEGATGSTASRYSPGRYSPGSIEPHPITPRFTSGSSSSNPGSSPEKSRDVNHEIEDLAHGILGDVATPDYGTESNLGDDARPTYSSSRFDPVYPEFRSTFSLRKKPYKGTSDTEY